MIKWDLFLECEDGLTCQKGKKKKKKKETLLGVPLWHSRLRTQPCHCSGSGDCYGKVFILGSGTSICHGHDQKTPTCVIRSIDEEKAFGKIEHSCMIKHSTNKEEGNCRGGVPVLAKQKQI